MEVYNGDTNNCNANLVFFILLALGLCRCAKDDCFKKMHKKVSIITS